MADDLGRIDELLTTLQDINVVFSQPHLDVVLVAVSRGHHPLVIDEGAPAEVEAGAVLQEDGEGQRALDSGSTDLGSGPLPS